MLVVKGPSSDSVNVASVPAGAAELNSPEVPVEVAKVVTVKLIRATRLPAHHVKLVQASVDNSKLFGSVCLFEPTLPELHHKGLRYLMDWWMQKRLLL